MHTARCRRRRGSISGSQRSSSRTISASIYCMNTKYTALPSVKSQKNWSETTPQFSTSFKPILNSGTPTGCETSRRRLLSSNSRAMPGSGSKTCFSASSKKVTWNVARIPPKLVSDYLLRICYFRWTKTCQQWSYSIRRLPSKTLVVTPKR